MRKNSAAVSLGRKGGPARAAKLTPEQRSESARKAVLARWAKAKEAAKKENISASKKLGPRKQIERTTPTTTIDTSDKALGTLLKRLKATVEPNEIRQLSDKLERVVFHKQFTNA